MKPMSADQAAQQQNRNAAGRYSTKSHAEVDLDLVQGPPRAEAESLAQVLRGLDASDPVVSGFNVRGRADEAAAERVRIAVRGGLDRISRNPDEDLMREQILDYADDLEREGGYGEFDDSASSEMAQWASQLRSIALTDQPRGAWANQHGYFGAAQNSDPYIAATAARDALMGERTMGRCRNFSDAEAMFVSMNLASESQMAHVASAAVEDCRNHGDTADFGLHVMRRAAAAVPEAYTFSEPDPE